MSASSNSHVKQRGSPVRWLFFSSALVLVSAVLVWQGLTEHGNPAPVTRAPGSFSAILDIGILVFREGLECILVLAAVTASMTGTQQTHRRPVAAGVGVGLVATLVTWFVAVHVLDDISSKISALNLQAATGLLAILVLLVVMNWFFHKMYWTGWISMHNRRKRDLLDADSKESDRQRIALGLGLLGFSSLYREGVEVVLFLQSYRLRLGSRVILYGVLIGLSLCVVVAVLTFAVHRRLPYRKMLVITGVMLGVVLLVMTGEQAQEMQLAHWLPTTRIAWLADRIPAWMGLWFSVFPTVQTLVGQAVAGILVLGSYVLAQRPAPTSKNELHGS
jgi:high-affinity iron transporter